MAAVVTAQSSGLMRFARGPRRALGAAGISLLVSRSSAAVCSERNCARSAHRSQLIPPIACGTLPGFFPAQGEQRLGQAAELQTEGHATPHIHRGRPLRLAVIVDVVDQIGSPGAGRKPFQR